ncbi:MAG: phosphotransferase [bacterium]|nr:phosphotransferase [bacterium]
MLDVRSRLNEQLPEMTGGRVRVPAPLGYVPELQMALFSWSRGAKPGSSPNELGDETGTTVDVLAALHRTWLPELPEFTVDDERAVVQRWYHLLRSVSEADVSQAAPLFDALLQAGESVDSFQRRTIHRDFYDSQLLCTRRTVTVLDLDTLAVGDPCVDLGNWIAHAWLALLCAGNGGGGLAALPDDVADRYEARLGPVDRRTLAFYCASAAFRLGAVHAFRTSTGRHAPRLWALARAALRGGPRRTCS